MARYTGKKTRFAKYGIESPPTQKEPGRFDHLLGILRERMQQAVNVMKELQLKIWKPKPQKNGRIRSYKRFYKGGGTIPEMANKAIEFIQSLFKRVLKSRAALIGIGTGLILAFVFTLILDFQKVKALANFEPSITTKIYDKNDILIAEIFAQKRNVVPLKKIPKDLINAIIAIEDNEFYDHFGINPKGIVRAFFVNLISGRIRQGGSTITQQLSKILLTSRKRSIFRKIKEAFIAIMMEFTYSKDEIMSLYLNQIYLGQGTYGVEAAALHYFDKHVWDLNLAESSLMAILPSAPNRYSPIRHTKRAIERHKIVMSKMVEMGFISVREAERSLYDFWTEYIKKLNTMWPTMNTMSSRVNQAPWFTEYIRRDLVNRYGREMVYEKGLHVYTTLDIKKQLVAQEVMKRRLDAQTETSSRLAFKNDDFIIDNYTDLVGLFSTLFDMPPFLKRGSRQNEKINSFFREEIVEELEGINYLTGLDSIGSFLDDYKYTYLEDKNLQKVEGCLVSIDHRNGYIEALVGGSEFASINQLNRVMQSKRQPGSSIKPLLYSAAIESGDFTPSTVVLDSPVVFSGFEGADWLPENYEGEYYGFVRLRKALMMSINIVSINIANQLGMDYVIKYFAKLLKLDNDTAKKRIPRNLSIALGSVEVSPIELTRAYGIIANGGKDVIPFAIRYIKDRDGSILENQEEEVKKILENETKDGSIQILRPDTAQIMISMMHSVISSGTGKGASPGRPAAGKTGTTNNWKDAWFVGYTPQLTTGIWVGYDKMGLSLGIGQAGGAVAAPIWGEYMSKAMADEPVMEFPVYAELLSTRVCEKSGLLPSSSCGETIDEVFIPSNVPDKVCEICSGAVSLVDLPDKGPRENISQQQRQSIIKDFKKQKSDSVLDSLEGDLLE